MEIKPSSSRRDWRSCGEVQQNGDVESLTGKIPYIATKNDAFNMDLYLNKNDRSGIPDLRVGDWEDFMPAGAPLIDFLAVATDQEASWKYPRPSKIRQYQENRGLTYNILKEVEVREVTIGLSSEDEVSRAKEWMLDQFRRDQKDFPSGVISMDVEEAKLTRYDELRLLGTLCIPEKTKPAESRLSLQNSVPSSSSLSEKDRWRQVPVRLMIGNGISWVLMIRVNINKENGVYQITKQTVSSSILDLIRTIPVCTGLGVRSDVKDVEKFYSDLSGEKV